MTHVSDDLLSALVDGAEVPADARAHVEGCADCRHRLAALRAVVTALAAPVAAPAPHVREAAVAAALLETTGTPTVRRLVPRRSRPAHARPARRMSTASAAAALIVALGVGGWVLSQLGNSGDPDAASTQTALRDTATQPDAAAAEAATDKLFSASPAAGSGAAAGAGYQAVGEIGTYTDIAALEAAYRTSAQQADATRVTTPPPCPAPDHVLPVWLASLTYKGEPAFARVRWVTASSQALEVLRQTDCVLLESRALEPTTPR